MRYTVAMARTFVRVDLEHAHAEQSFSAAMGQLGFAHTIKSRKTRKTLRLPSGMYVIKRTGPVEALELVRQAARDSKVRARIFCVPVDGNISFSNLRPI